jgi:hypothetical protein
MSALYECWTGGQEMTDYFAIFGHSLEGLPSLLLLVALIGVLFLIYYALKHNNFVKAIFNCKLFNFSLETEKSPPKLLDK